MSLSPQARHQAIIEYLNEINKTTKVFEARWHESQLLTSRVLKSTPVPTYINHKWKQNDIEQLFIRAQCSMGRDFQLSMQQSFGSKYKPKLTKKRKSFRGKKSSKRKSDGDIRSLSDLSQISKLYQNGSRDSDEENVNTSPLYESSFSKMKKNSSAKTLLKQSESMSLTRNRNNVSKYKTKQSKRHRVESKQQKKDTNPYLDASVLAQVDSGTFSPKSPDSNQFSLDSIPDEGTKMSPISAQKMLQQMPWKSMEDFGISMEWNVRITRDKDVIKANLERENKRLLERIKEIENQLKQQKQKNGINTVNESNDNDIKYNFDGFEDSIIILRSECNNKPLITKEGKLEISKGFIGFEIYSKWKMIKCANGIYKFREYNEYNTANNNSNMIRVLGNAGSYTENGEIDVKGNDTGHCQFRAHLVANKNVIMLESVMFPNKYLAANKNGNVFVFNCDDDMMIMDNNQCMFQVLMIQNNIIIKIQRLDNGKIFPLRVDLNDSISNIKSIIQMKENVSIKKQILYFENDELKDNKSLNTYNIRNNNIIDLKIVSTKKQIQILNGNDAKESEDENMSSSDDYNSESDDEYTSSSTDSDYNSQSDDDFKEENENENSDEDAVDEDDYVPKLNRITSKWRKCVNDMDVHNGGISCIACSPIDYRVITGGEHDSSLRIWQPKKTEKNDGKLLSEITFVPKRKANVDGTVFSVNMSEDGVLIAAGCSWKKTQNGYVVVWNMKKGGNILCDLKSKQLDKQNSGPIKRGRHARAMSLELNTKSLMASSKRVSASKLFKIKRTDSVSSLRFGVVHSVKLMKFKSKKKKRMNYYLFGGDTTGCVLCWNLSLKNKEIPICRINAGNDVIHDLAIIENKYLFSVSHDKTMRYCNIKGLRKKKPMTDDINDEKSAEKRKFAAVDTMQIYKDAEYALHSIALNLNTKNKIQLVFGSRKCTQFEMNQLVVIRHKYGKYLSVKKNNKNKRVLTGHADSNELLHKYTKWNIEYLDKDKIRLRSRKSGKYLRMSRNGTAIDVLGTGIASEHESIFKWKVNEKTLQSQKYPKYFMAVHKENNAIISVKKQQINGNISIEFELFDSNKLNAFKSFFDYVYEPPQDLDRICNLKVRKKLLIVQRKDINHVKVFTLANGKDRNTLLKRFRIGKCDCYKNDIDYQRNQLYNMKLKYGRKKSDEEEKHVFRIYDSGISFNQKYAVLCVGIFGKNNMRKAIEFSLKGFKIPRSARKPSSHSFCPKSM